MSQARVPVPVIYAYDSTSCNSLGFPWILTKSVHGRTADVAWRSLMPEPKKNLIRQLARLQADLFAVRHDHLGSIYGDAPSLGTAFPSVIRNHPKVLLSSFVTGVVFFPLTALIVIVFNLCASLLSKRQPYYIGPMLD